MIRFILAAIVIVAGMSSASIRQSFAAPAGGATFQCNYLGQTADGSCIEAFVSTTNSLLDLNNNCYRFNGTAASPASADSQYDENVGGGCGIKADNAGHAFRIALGQQKRQAFFMYGGIIPLSDRIWQGFNQSSGQMIPALNPTARPIGNVFISSTKGAFASPDILAAAAVSGDTLTIPHPPTGMAAWNSNGDRFWFHGNQSNITVNCAAGTIIYGQIGLFSANVSVNGCGSAYNAASSNQYPCFLLASGDAGDRNPTITNFVAHDCNNGVLFGGSGGGFVTLTNGVIYHNGWGACDGLTHNLYLSINGSLTPYVVDSPSPAMVLTNIVSRDQKCGGDPFKLRLNGGTIDGFDALARSGQYSTEALFANWEFSMPCAGPFTVKHGTANRAPLTGASGGGGTDGNFGIIDYGSEYPGRADGVHEVNCPPSANFTANTHGTTMDGISDPYQLSVGDILQSASVTVPGNTIIMSVDRRANTAILSNEVPAATGGTFNQTRDNRTTISFVNAVDEGVSLGGFQASNFIHCKSNPSLCSGYKITIDHINYVDLRTDAHGNLLPSRCGSRFNDWAGPGVIDGGDNHCYTSREALAKALGIAAGTVDAYGNPCCSYPYVFPRGAENQWPLKD